MNPGRKNGETSPIKSRRINSPEDRNYFKVSALAKCFYVAESTVYKKIKAGMIPIVRIDGTMRISKQTIRKIEEFGRLCQSLEKSLVL